MTDVKREIQQIHLNIKDLQRRAAAIQRACKHNWVPDYPKDPDSSTPLCTICGVRGFGWWCEPSPSKTCRYGDDLDHCIYCNWPSERK